MFAKIPYRKLCTVYLTIIVSTAWSAVAQLVECGYLIKRNIVGLDPIKSASKLGQFNLPYFIDVFQMISYCSLLSGVYARGS